jgi:hypothetical protein
MHHKKPKAVFHPESIHLVKVNAGAIDIYSPFDFDESLLQSHAFDAGVVLHFDVADGLCILNYDLQLATLSSEEQGEEATCKLQFILLYTVENLEHYISESKDGQLDPDDVLAEALAEMAHSTLRGLLFPLIQHTALKYFILPVVEANRLLK